MLLLPIFLRGRGSWRFAAAALVAFGLAWIPFALGGVDPSVGLRTYLEHWSFNSPVYALLSWAVPWDLPVRMLPFLFVLLAGWHVVRAKHELMNSIPLILFGFLILSPTLHPWYALWVLPWLGPRPHLGLLAFVAAMGLGYEVWWELERFAVWRLDPAWSAALWALVAAGWILQWGRNSSEKRRLAGQKG